MNSRETDAAVGAMRVGPSGWLTSVRYSPSPHADERPGGTKDVRLIVLHGVSLPPGQFGGPWAEAFFAGRLDVREHPYFEKICALRVSPHLLIDRRGGVVQFVACGRRAWHAGRSQWQGHVDCNDFSIGVELEGTDDVPYTDRQYGVLVQLILCLREAYPRIDNDAIVGHSDIAPGRKTDPGPAFDWGLLARRLAHAGYNFRRLSTREEEGRSA